MKVKFIFKWYYLWVGVYFNKGRNNRWFPILYV